MSKIVIKLPQYDSLCKIRNYFKWGSFMKVLHETELPGIRNEYTSRQISLTPAKRKARDQLCSALAVSRY